MVTPAGLLALVAVAFFGPRFAPVLAGTRFLVVVVVSVTTGAAFGGSLPVSGFSIAPCDYARDGRYCNKHLRKRDVRTCGTPCSFTSHCFLQEVSIDGPCRAWDRFGRIAERVDNATEWAEVSNNLQVKGRSVGNVKYLVIGRRVYCTARILT